MVRIISKTWFWRKYVCAVPLFYFVLVLSSTHAFSQLSSDVSTADSYSKKFKDDQILCSSSYQFFTFGKGKNSLGDQVVTIEENSEYEYVSMKKYTSTTHPEFYNQFIQLKEFKKANKVGAKYVNSAARGIDRTVTDDGIFFDDSRVQYYPIRFDDKGAMTRITVKKQYTDGKYLTRLFFTDMHPVKERVIEFKVPDWLQVDFKLFNAEKGMVEKNVTQKSGYSFYTFIMKDVPAFKPEYLRIGRAYTDPHIVVQIKTFESKGEVLKGFDKLEDVYAWNNRLYKMAANQQGDLKTLVAKITEGKSNDLDKIRAIYYWVQDNIRYVAYEDGLSGYIPATAQDVAAKKYGDCKGMANLLTELLVIAGYDAHFSWIGTRHLPYPQSLPALCVNNHAIATLYHNGQTYFLDATENYVPLAENAFRIQGKEVMVSKGTKYEIQKVPVSNAADNMMITKADFVLSGDKLTGKIKLTLTGNERTEFHQKFQELPLPKQKETLNNYLEFGNRNLVASNVTTSDLNNRDIAVNIEGDVDFSNAVNKINNDIYMGIDFFPNSLEKLIPDEKRVEGYDLDALIKFEDDITLTIPANSRIVDKPEDLTLSYDGFEFSGVYSISGNKISLHKTLVIKNELIRKTDFANWTGFIKSIKDFNSNFLSITTK